MTIKSKLAGWMTGLGRMTHDLGDAAASFDTDEHDTDTSVTDEAGMSDILHSRSGKQMSRRMTHSHDCSPSAPMGRIELIA